MRLSPEAIREFQAICRDEFGIELSDSDAEQRAWEVLDFFWLLAGGEKRPPDDHFDNSKPDPLR